MPLKKGGLGRGLDALIPKTRESVSGVSTGSEMSVSLSGESPSVKQIPVGQIIPNPRQPRSHFDADEISELASSIKEHGIIQPLLVKSGTRENEYILIAGERRLQAARQADLETVPAILREASDQELIELALIENVQRADLSPLETAEAYHQLVDEFQLSHEEVATRVGKSRVSITNTLRLRKLVSFVQEALADGRISEGHARALLALPTSQAQTAALHTILTKELNVRQTEDLVRKLCGQKPDPEPKPKQETPEILDLQEQLRSRFKTKVDINQGKKGGMITIHYYSGEELDYILEIISGK
ncbi:MAG: ParB/RepB/Spo0J family partition protein [Chloroflexota bacterium]|jgi:ParB family chromosome partitioning protein